MFSFTRLGGADPVLGVEMASTGEVACFGADMHEAFLKSLVATNFALPKSSVLFGAEGAVLHDLVKSAHKLKALGFKLYGTPAAADFFNARGVETVVRARAARRSGPAGKRFDKPETKSIQATHEHSPNHPRLGASGRSLAGRLRRRG